MENKKLYALVLGALAVAAAIGSVATVSFASAQTPANQTKDTKVLKWQAGGSDEKFIQELPKVNGTINASNEIMSKVKVDFVNAGSTAGKAASGRVVGGDLTIVNGYVVYSFSVISGSTEKNVIVDAGSGNVLDSSKGFPADLLSEMNGAGFFGFCDEGF
jgi:uncharacterized membrane protein YkoI